MASVSTDPGPIVAQLRGINERLDAGFDSVTRLLESVYACLETTEKRPDWVWQRAVTLSDKLLFELVATEVRQDVERMNEFAANMGHGDARYHIKEHGSGTQLTVSLRVEGQGDRDFGNHTLSVSNQRVIMRKPDDFGVHSILLDATAQSDDPHFVLVPGEPQGDPLELWEASRILLEGLFFPAG